MSLSSSGATGTARKALFEAGILSLRFPFGSRRGRKNSFTNSSAGIGPTHDFRKFAVRLSWRFLTIRARNPSLGELKVLTIGALFGRNRIVSIGTLCDIVLRGGVDFLRFLENSFLRG